MGEGIDPAALRVPVSLRPIAFCTVPFGEKAAVRPCRVSRVTVPVALRLAVRPVATAFRVMAPDVLRTPPRAFPARFWTVPDGVKVAVRVEGRFWRRWLPH
jgi:hypothetical protein